MLYAVLFEDNTALATDVRRQHMSARALLLSRWSRAGPSHAKFGDVPTIDPVIGYNKSNMSALLKRSLSRVD
jgi:hypothetical protein